MIAYLNGTIIYKDEKNLIIRCGDVGYMVSVPGYVLLEHKNGDEVELYTYQQISGRDESIELFGFMQAEELEFFKQLIGISGVGPRSALGTLSVATVIELKKTISRGDPELLTKVAGIGKKTAERIVIELKDKMVFVVGDAIESADTTVDNEVYEALEGLGYKTADIREALREVPGDIDSSEEKIKQLLKSLSKNI